MFRLVLLTAFVFVSISSYKNGAPAFMCQGNVNRPIHNSFMPNNRQPPYRFQLNVTGKYRPEEPVAITLKGDKATFKGFFVTSDTTTWMFDGSVLNTTTAAKAVPNCGMTHTDNSNKMAVTLIWTPPKRAHVGNIQFVATVVYNMSLFWINVRSDPLEPDMTMYRNLQDIYAEQQKLYAEQMKLYQEQQAKLLKQGGAKSTGGNKVPTNPGYYNPYPYSYYSPMGGVPPEHGAPTPTGGAQSGLSNQGTGRQSGLGNKSNGGQTGPGNQGAGRQSGLGNQGTGPQSGFGNQGTRRQSGLGNQGTGRQTGLGSQGTAFQTRPVTQ